MPFIAMRLACVSIMYVIFVVFTMTAGLDGAHFAIVPPIAMLPWDIDMLSIANAGRV
jgi:hypothetical protein